GGRSAGDDRADLVRQTAGVLLDQLAERDSVWRLVAAWLGDDAGDRPEARALGAVPAEAGPPGATVGNDPGDVCERLDVVDQRRPCEVPDLGGERWLQPGHRASPLHRLEHRRLLAGDVGAGAHDERQAQTVEQPRLGELLQRLVDSRPGKRIFLAEV